MLARRAVKAGRVPSRSKVLRRMKAMVRDDSILMAGVTGPFTLAARLMQMDASGDGRTREFPESALEVALRWSREFPAPSSKWRQRDHDREEVLPVLSQELCAAWACGLEPAFNVIRFYGALPVRN